MKQKYTISIIGILILFLFNVLVQNTSYARPGGGHSYKSSKKEKSGSSSDSRSSTTSNYSTSDDKKTFWDDIEVDEDSDTSDVEVPTWVYWLLAITFGLLGIIIIILNLNDYKNKKGKTSLGPTKKNIELKANTIVNDIRRIQKTDPGFSKTLFLDFVASVFIKYYSWQGKKEFENLSPYLLEEEITKNINRKVKKEINEIVIGSLNISNIYASTTLITVEIDANYTVLQQDKNTRYAVVERWSFKRNPDVLSPEPEKLRELSCPQCGASLDFTDSGTCNSCGTLVKNGEMHWFVSSHNILHKDAFETSGLAHYEKEIGTKSNTIKNNRIERVLEQFGENHNIDTKEWLNKFNLEVASEYFQKIYIAWSQNNLNKVRHLLSDRLYGSFMFWLAAYKKEGLTNKLDNVEIKKTELAKIELDKYYESITVRIFASCNDYVISQDGKVAGGSKKKQRKFSEYWTFIRRAGVEKDCYDYGTCPNCGAPADKITGQSGICEYCNTKISNGDFSWVLAVIAQDEVYKG